MSEPPPINRRHSLARLALYGASVLGVPLLRRNTSDGKASKKTKKDADVEEGREQEQNWLGTRKVPFAQAPLKALLHERPEYVFIGDSMVRAHIDPAELTKLSGHPVSTLWLPNSTSARWYLMLKNYVIRSGVKPKRVVFCFRNCLWNMPTFRVNGPFWDNIERCMPVPHDEVVSRILGSEPRREGGLLGKLLREDLYRVQYSAEGARRAVQKRAALLSGNDLAAVQLATNQRFNFQNFRHGITVEEEFDGITNNAPFSKDPAKSFLPHAIELAKSVGISVYFVRIKRRPRKGSDSHDSSEQRKYMSQFEAYVKEQGCGFYDFTNDQDLHVEMYAEGDHLADEHTAWFSRHLFEKIGKEVFA